MRYKPGQKEATRQRIVAAAEASFKKNGFNGIGVDGLARAAGVTSGAFYTHFSSKKSVFIASILSSMEALDASIASHQSATDKDWWLAFADAYLHDTHTRSADDSCPLTSLSSDVSRSEDDVRAVFEEALVKIVARASEYEEEQAAEKTWSRLAMLVGGVMLSRTVKDDAVAQDIVASVKAGLR